MTPRTTLRFATRCARGLITIAAVASLGGGACSATTSGISEPIPSWLQDSIRVVQQQPPRNPPAVVSRLDFADGTRAYQITPGCCDMFDVLYAVDGRAICAPSGGLSGRGDGKCPAALLVEPKEKKVLWRDARTR